MVLKGAMAHTAGLYATAPHPMEEAIPLLIDNHWLSEMQQPLSLRPQGRGSGCISCSKR
jgi:hypothetical protein